MMHMESRRIAPHIHICIIWRVASHLQAPAANSLSYPGFQCRIMGVIYDRGGI